MPTLQEIHTNFNPPPPRLTAILSGGTSGIGSYTALHLARLIPLPTLYILGRSQPAYTALHTQLIALNPQGTYHFLAGDLSLITGVDSVCAQIRKNETHINVLVLSQGIFGVGEDTSEGIRSGASLLLHSRTRMTLNLLPLLQAAPEGEVRRVVSVFAGTKEGAVIGDARDIQMKGAGTTSPLKLRGVAATMVTLLMEECQKRAPEVGFVHAFPGYVRGNSARGGGLGRMVLRGLYAAVGPWLFIPEGEVGERFAWYALGDAFKGKGEGSVMGSDGMVGSGVYVVDEKGEVAGEAIVNVLEEERRKGTREIVWEEVKKDFLRVTGKETL